MALNQRYHRNFPQEFILVPVMLEKHFHGTYYKAMFLVWGKLAKNVKRFLSDQINEDKIYFEQ